jgi:hypothetical protein
MRAGAERAEVTVEQVVRELKLIDFSDIRKVVSWRNELVTRTEKGKDGEPVMVLMPRVMIADADKISDEAARPVAEVSQTVNGTLRVKLHDKHAALVSIARCMLSEHFGQLAWQFKRMSGSSGLKVQAAIACGGPFPPAARAPRAATWLPRRRGA